MIVFQASLHLLSTYYLPKPRVRPWRDRKARCPWGANASRWQTCKQTITILRCKLTDGNIHEEHLWQTAGIQLCLSGLMVVRPCINHTLPVRVAGFIYPPLVGNLLDSWRFWCSQSWNNFPIFFFKERCIQYVGRSSLSLKKKKKKKKT